MPYRLLALALAPLLVVQGRRVRRTTPRLPEPAGERAGVAGAGAPLRLLVLGDSAAAGVGAASQADALTGRLVARLAARHTVRWTLLARTGATTRATLATLAAQAPPPSDVVVVSLGVNDVTSGRAIAAWLRDLDALVSLLQARAGARHVLLSALPPMHAFPARPQPLRWCLGRRARHLDRALARWAARRPGCEHVPHAFEMAAAHMASDGFHPGPPIYEAWSADLARRVLAGPAAR
jgi:lysophospholipase L1-like esterase